MKYQNFEDLAAAIRSASSVKIDITISGEDLCDPSDIDFGHNSYIDVEKVAKKIYEDRRRREEFFENCSLFGEPAWDILLDLFVNNSIGRSVSVKSASLGSAVPDTTALRWLRVLERSGLIYFAQDQSDARRKLISLTQEGERQMRRYLIAVAR